MKKIKVLFCYLFFGKRDSNAEQCDESDGVGETLDSMFQIQLSLKLISNSRGFFLL